MPFAFKSLIRGLACAAVIIPGAASAQDAASEFGLELNSAADTDSGSCRLTFVASNKTETALDRTAYQVGIFDAGGAVTRLLVLEFGALIEGKTKIVQFDLGDTQCSNISRMIINDVTGCTQSSDGQESDICLAQLNASSRTDIEFGL